MYVAKRARLLRDAAGWIDLAGREALALVLGTLNEYQARLYVAEKALAFGRGGITRLASLTGMS